MHRFHNKAKHRQQKSWERGAAVTEFIFVIPVIAALFYTCFTINEHIEDREVMLLTIRNTAALGHADLETQIDSVIKDLNAHSQIAKKDAVAVKAAVDTVSYGGYEIKLSTTEAALSEENYDQVEKAYEGDTSPAYRDTSKLLGAAGRFGGQAIDFVKNIGAPAFNIFIPDVPTRHDVSITVRDDANLFYRSLMVLSVWAFEKGSVTATAVPEETHLRRVFNRPSAGFHPDDYRYEAVIGFALGQIKERVHWSRPYELTNAMRRDGIAKPRGSDDGIGDGFVARCMMNFMADSKCEGPTMHSSVIRLVGIVKGVVQLIVSVFSGGGAEVANALSTEAIDEAIGEITEKIGSDIEKEIGEKVTPDPDKVIAQKSEGVKKKITGDFKKSFEDQEGKINELP